MVPNPRVLKAYLDHFLPRDVVGPVVVFSLYVPEAYTTLGWGLVFVLSLVVVAYWGTVDDPAVEELQERIEEIEAEEAAADDGTA
jgi:hypothetical protein